MTTEQMLVQINELKEKAAARDAEIERAQLAKARASAQLENLSETLRERFDEIDEWEGATVLLETLKMIAEDALAETLAKFAEAGIE